MKLPFFTGQNYGIYKHYNKKITNNLGKPMKKCILLKVLAMSARKPSKPLGENLFQMLINCVSYNSQKKLCV